MLIAKVLLCGAVTLVVGERVAFSAFAFALGLGLGLATIIRRTAPSISAFVGLPFLLPIIAAVLPSSFSGDVSRFLSQQIGTVMMTAHYHGSEPFGR